MSIHNIDKYSTIHNTFNEAKLETFCNCLGGPSGIHRIHLRPTTRINDHREQKLPTLININCQAHIQRLKTLRKYTRAPMLYLPG
ncbi:hypothetical protein QQP08_014802 [Theobroma cacao]|nr:hypothetical protein QQP08_014802 [Theobroma cacao]